MTNLYKNSKTAFRSLHFVFLISLYLVTSTMLHAEDMTSRMGKIQQNFKGLTTQVSDLQKRVTEYVAGATDKANIDDASLAAIDSDWVKTMKIITQVIAYSKPAGTLMFNIDEALMAAEIDIKRMKKSGKNLSQHIKTMEKDKLELEKVKKNIKRIHKDANEFKKSLRNKRYEYSYWNRVKQFHYIVETMKEVVGKLNKTVTDLKEVSNHKIIYSGPKPIPN